MNVFYFVIHIRPRFVDQRYQQIKNPGNKTQTQNIYIILDFIIKLMYLHKTFKK